MLQIQNHVLILCFSIGLLLIDSVQGDEQGAEIYRAQCAACHGNNGQGTAEHYSDPLRGDLALSQLEKLIVKTMPEEHPETCVGDDAKLVAAFVYDRFYSLEAQRKSNKSRIELSRLTVRQLRESIVDLLGVFSSEVNVSNARGLEANYFASRNWTEKRRLSSQVDRTIDFSSGVPHFDPTGKYTSLKKAEDPKKDVNLMNQGFSTYWKGGLIPVETGTYEILVESKNGFSLAVNDLKNSLIDRKVRSDDVVEHRASIFLIGGRPVGLSLYLFSYPQPPAKIRLLWKRPNGIVEVIPESSLIPVSPREICICSTVFPADDASYGFERGISVSEQWDRATTDAAIETAEWVSQRMWKLAGTTENDKDSSTKLRDFCYQFVGRAFATTLSEDDREFFVGRHFGQEISQKDKVKRVVLLALKSPRFLYPVIQSRRRSDEVARNLALTLWDSLPDKQLYKLADKGQLVDPKIVERESRRMVRDLRSRQKLRMFFLDWLKAERAASSTKDKTAYPDFDQPLVSDLQTSLLLYLDEVVWKDNSDYRQLFLADYLYVNKRIGEFYGIPVSGDSFDKVSGAVGNRSGVLTHPFLMSGLAYSKDSSPIHRGVFIAKQILGTSLRQPPDDVKPLTEEFNPTMTTRERVEHQTKETGCMSCHQVINPLGFSLENYDAVGRYRTHEKSKRIDVNSIYTTPEGEDVEIGGARDLASFLASSERVQKSFIRQLFNYYTKQSLDAVGKNQVDELHQKFKNSDFNIEKLLVEISLVPMNYQSETGGK
ncbi:DUF1588 domain-containing protein [Mariniblastus sp.]|nr:DUF1588 domain-containing protein [Mariniblastus sp.]